MPALADPDGLPGHGQSALIEERDVASTSRLSVSPVGDWLIYVESAA